MSSSGSGWRTCICALSSATPRRALGIGGSEVAAAEPDARRLIRLAPYRESGYRLLMEALARRGNSAEALLVYEQLRIVLRDAVGAAPSPASQALHRRLLGETG